MVGFLCIKAALIKAAFLFAIQAELDKTILPQLSFVKPIECW
jgi:hypothetical protein